MRRTNIAGVLMLAAAPWIAGGALHSRLARLSAAACLQPSEPPGGRRARSHRGRGKGDRSISVAESKRRARKRLNQQRHEAHCRGR